MMEEIFLQRKGSPNEVNYFMVHKAVTAVLKEMERNGWLQEEVEQFPKYMESAIKKNSEQLEKTKPFTIYRVIQDTP